MRRVALAVQLALTHSHSAVRCLSAHANAIMQVGRFRADDAGSCQAIRDWVACAIADRVRPGPGGWVLKPCLLGMGGQACTHRSPLFEKQGRAHASCYQRRTPPRPASSAAAAWGCERAPHNAIVCWSLHVACCIGLMRSHPTTLRTKFAQTLLHSTNNVPRGMRCRRHAAWRVMLNGS